MTQPQQEPAGPAARAARFACLAAALLTGWLSWACAAAPVGPPTEAAPAAEDRALDAAIEAALAEATSRASLHLFVECRGDSGLDSVELFGSGVGIADGRRQFAAPSAVLAAALELLRDSGFAAMPATFGGHGGDPAQPPRAGAEGLAGSAARLVCRVELALDGLAHSVLQLAKGFQSPTFRGLALELLRICQEPARTGIEAADLADGLAKVAAHRLAPEVFHLLLNRRPDRAADGAGLLLRVDGQRATARGFEPTSGYGETRELRLGADELAALAGRLAAAEVYGMPVNLWSPAYTDLSIGVLSHRVSIQARQFANMGPSTHGESQRSFDRLQADLGDLAARVLATGRSSPSG